MILCVKMKKKKENITPEELKLKINDNNYKMDFFSSNSFFIVFSRIPPCTNIKQSYFKKTTE